MYSGTSSGVSAGICLLTEAMYMHFYESMNSVMRSNYCLLSPRDRQPWNESFEPEMSQPLVGWRQQNTRTESLQAMQLWTGSHYVLTIVCISTFCIIYILYMCEVMSNHDAKQKARQKCTEPPCHQKANLIRAYTIIFFRTNSTRSGGQGNWPNLFISNGGQPAAIVFQNCIINVFHTWIKLPHLVLYGKTPS